MYGNVIHSIKAAVRNMMPIEVTIVELIFSFLLYQIDEVNLR